MRPQGAQGPLSVTFDAFARYQREDAWTWEHMALTRARVLVASDGARSQLEAIIAGVLEQDRDPAKLREDVLAMRGEMARHKAPAGPLDAKLLRGGLVDLEFLVHFLQLRDLTGFTPDLGRAIDALVAAGLLPQELCKAHDLMTRILVSARLLAPDLSDPPPAAARALARACCCETYDGLLRSLGETRQMVAVAWQRVFGQELENYE